MISFVLFGSLVVFFAIGVPIAFSLGLASLCAIYYAGTLPPVLLIQKLFSANDSFPLMSIPYFILAGSLMSKGGMSVRLVNLASALVGKLPGGLAVVAVLGCVFFGALSGSPVATVAAVGGVLVPSMIQKGYAAPFCGAVMAAAGPLGALIPPSIALIIYGVSAGESISSLFIATIFPGLLMGAALMVASGFLAHRKGYGGDMESHGSIPRLLRESIWALFMPVIILGGIYGGIFTPTEAAVVTVVYGLIVGAFIYRELKWHMARDVLVESLVGTAAVMVIIDFSSVLSGFLTAERIPQMVSAAFLALTDNAFIIILSINLIMVIIGTFMDAAPAIVILTPIFLPLVKALGYDPIHFGTIMCTNLLIGLVTPPVGVTLFMGSRIAKVKVDEVVGEVWPLLIVMFGVLILVNVFPWLSLVLVR